MPANCHPPIRRPMNPLRGPAARPDPERLGHLRRDRCPARLRRRATRQFPFDCFVSKTITLAPRQGNPPPRLYETPAGLINSIGLPNKGLEGFLDSDLPQLAELPVPLCVSVMGFSRDELATLVGAVAARDEVALLELNFSCPNVETGLIMGADPSETARSVERVRPLTAQAADREAHAQRHRPGRGRRRGPGGRRGRRLADQHAEGHGARPARVRPAMARRRDGRGVRPGGAGDRAPAGRERCAAVSIPVVGMGGIESGRDAADSCAQAQQLSRSAPPASATRRPARASRPNYAAFLGVSGTFCRPGRISASADSTKSLQRRPKGVK